MKIFSAVQIRQWDAYTILNEPISSVNLMERAAAACFSWIIKHFSSNSFTIFCGTGNNGGDGLAVARMLLKNGYEVDIYILEGDKKSEDYNTNLHRLLENSASIKLIDKNHFPDIPPNAVIIDALLGTGLSRPLKDEFADLVSNINEANKTIISLDIPTGLLADSLTAGSTTIKANFTLSFQLNKLSFMLADNYQYTGNVVLLNISLHPQYYNNTSTLFNTIELPDIIEIYKPGTQFAHKYNFGHALLFAGSKNMMGAALLCSGACLRTGAGLVTVYTEEDTQAVIQIALPEAITSTEKDFEKLCLKKAVIGIGPGLEIKEENKQLLKKIISTYTGQLVIDAAALQMLAEDINMLKLAKPGAIILTPHTGEFEKLFGKTNSDFERLEIARQKSMELNCHIILKGHHTLVACPDGNACFNTTGNAGMATAGSGDVLTGMLTGFLARGYVPRQACLLAVFMHGMAGDFAANKMSQEAMIAGDIIDFIGESFKNISAEKQSDLKYNTP
jgi:NAD(P)H-hydrate epimerase